MMSYRYLPVEFSPCCGHVATMATGGARESFVFLLATVALAAKEVGEENLYCKCTWIDNWWFHLIEDLPHILGSPKDGEAMFVRDAAGNSTRRSLSSWQLLEKLVLKERLCQHESSLLEMLSVHTLCVPGMLATDLLCTLYYSFAFRSTAQLLLLAARRARRMRLLFNQAKACLDATPWPFDIEDLEEFTTSWVEFEAEVWPPQGTPRAGEAPPPPRWTGRSKTKPRSSLPADLRRCIPLQRGAAASQSSMAAHCWARRATSMDSSCKDCCDPRFPRGRRECFGGVWTFEACCAPDDLTAGWGPPPQAVETLTSAESHSGLFRQLRELRGELRKARQRPGNQGRSAENQGQGTANWDQLRQWVEAQLALPASEGGRQKLFPELDLLVSTRACVGPQMELPWFLLGGRAEDAGVELASRSGALCGTGLPVAGELVSRPGRRATVPSGGIDQEPPGLHRLEAYGLELMAPCRVQNASADGRCFCGAEPCSTWTDFGRQCCREDDGIVQRPQRAIAAQATALTKPRTNS
eukprot:s938_g3.t1